MSSDRTEKDALDDMIGHAVEIYFAPEQGIAECGPVDRTYSKLLWHDEYAIGLWPYADSVREVVCYKRFIMLIRKKVS